MATSSRRVVPVDGDKVSRSVSAKPSAKKPAAKKSSSKASPYHLRISRLTVDKLGVKLYDKASAVVAELIANGYDADAETVTVCLPLNLQLASQAGGKLKDLGYVIDVEDDGHGMTPEEISRISAQIARGGGREGGGIGLDLLARLCEHLGWRLSFVSAPGRGTVSRLYLGTCLHSERIKP